MSILQDLHRYRLDLLESTGSTQNQLEQFLNFSGFRLDELLYRESVYNLYVEFLKDNK